VKRWEEMKEQRAALTAEEITKNEKMYLDKYKNLCQIGGRTRTAKKNWFGERGTLKKETSGRGKGGHRQRWDAGTAEKTEASKVWCREIAGRGDGEAVGTTGGFLVTQTGSKKGKGLGGKKKIKKMREP